MVRTARKNSLRGRAALGMKGLAHVIQSGALMLGGFATGQGGYAGARSNTRRTRNWSAGEGSPATDVLPGLEILRGRSRDLERNHPLVVGAMRSKSNGVIGAGLVLRSTIDADVLGIAQEKVAELQYQIEREWEIFEREADFTGQMHLRDLQRLMYRSAQVSGDIGISRRYRKRPGETYGTRIVLLEADRISNPDRRADSPVVQGGVQLAADGEVQGFHVSDRHPGDMMGPGLTWSFVPRRGAASGLVQMVLMPSEIVRPGQVRGVPLFAPIIEDLKQLGEYREAELKAAINDAYLFAFETPATPVDEDGSPIITRPDGQEDADGELTLSDLMVTTLDPGSKVEVKQPARPNQAFGDFVRAFCEFLGAALDLPYEVLLMHFGSSFSASRGALEIARKGFLVEQSRFVRYGLDVIREWQFTEMVASGRFSAPGFFDDPIKRAAWLGRVWIGPTGIQINPSVEASADKIDIDMGTKSREQVMTERTGGDFDTKSRQILRERSVLGGTQPGPSTGPDTQTQTPGQQGN